MIFLFFLGFQHVALQSPRISQGSDARQFEEAIRRVDGKVDRVAAVASQCSEGRRDPMGKDMGKRWNVRIKIPNTMGSYGIYGISIRYHGVI